MFNFFYLFQNKSPTILPTLPETVPQPKVIETDVNISPKNDGPRFGKLYQIQVSPDVKLKVDAWSWLGHIQDRHYNGELQEKNGDWVLFDPQHPAKKILDRDILPAVTKYCQIILLMDKQYIESDPNTYIDNRGTTWKKVTA
jgi:hypothetical protein